MSLGTFLGAVGDAFGGYARDQQQHTANALASQREAREQALQSAQMQDYQAQASQRTAQAAQAKLERDAWAQYGAAAQNGDPAAIAQIVGVMGPKGSAMLKELTKEPKPAPVGHWQYGGVGPDGQPVLFNSLTGETMKGGGLRGGSGGNSVDVHKAAVLKSQIADAVGQQRVARATTQYPLSARATSADSANYNQAAAAIPKLQQRADSLRGVLDKVAAGMTGTGTPLPNPTLQPDPQQSASAEWNAVSEKYKRALSIGVDPNQARQAYTTDVTNIARKYGLSK